MTLQDAVRRIAATEDEMFRKTLNKSADRIDELEAALRKITLLEIGTPLQDARIICREALKEASS